MTYKNMWDQWLSFRIHDDYSIQYHECQQKFCGKDLFVYEFWQIHTLILKNSCKNP